MTESMVRCHNRYGHIHYKTYSVRIIWEDEKKTTTSGIREGQEQGEVRVFFFTYTGETLHRSKTTLLPVQFN